MSYSDYGPLGRWLEFGINVHMGQQFGLANQLLFFDRVRGDYPAGGIGRSNVVEAPPLTRNGRTATTGRQTRFPGSDCHSGDRRIDFPAGRRVVDRHAAA